MGQISVGLRTVACFFIKVYRYLFSFFLPPSCRFYPSCSEYALTAISQKGIVKGGALTTFRLLRCHPWSQGGYDPVLLDKENS